MSFPRIVATNRDAEKLWKYLLAYRNRMSTIRLVWRHEIQLEDNVLMGIIPAEEALVSAQVLRRETASNCMQTRPS